jgi:hypothetical protein
VSVIAHKFLVDTLKDMDIDDEIFHKVNIMRSDQPGFLNMMNTNPNMIIFTELVHHADRLDPEPDTDEHRAFVNLLKLIAMAFDESDYWKSRIGWFMWFMVCYAKYDSYYPMAWGFNYDPMNWYRVNEPHRPPELEMVQRDDPFNLKGECYVHPEWYKYIEEDKCIAKVNEELAKKNVDEDSEEVEGDS